MSVKNVILKKKIDGVVYDIHTQTSAGLVIYGNSTVAAELANLADGLSKVSTSTVVDQKIKDACDELYNKILGLTDQDQTIDEAYDTLKEIAAYINEHGDVTTAFNALKNTVGDANSGLVKDVADLQTTVGDANSGLVKGLADLQAAFEAQDYSKVTAGTNNGQIKVDGTDMTVYTHPDTHAATMIVEDNDHKFVTAAQKQKIDDCAKVEIVSGDADVTDETSLYFVEITEQSEEP